MNEKFIQTMRDVKDNLPGQKVVSVYNNPDGRFVLVFESGHYIDILNSAVKDYKLGQALKDKKLDLVANLPEEKSKKKEEKSK